MRLLASIVCAGLFTACAGTAAPLTPTTAPAIAPAVTSTTTATPMARAGSATATTPPASATPARQPTATVAQAASAVGYLEGQASIGPLVPVERMGVPSPTPSPAVCTSRGLAIYDASGQTLVTSFSFLPDCSYRVPLKPGNYVVRLSQQQGIGGSKTLPKTTTIESGKTVRLDIDIDTGIR